MLACEFCKKTYKNKYTLKNHQTKTKRCLAIQNKIIRNNLVCKDCQNELTTKQNLIRHKKICVSRNERLIQEKHKSRIEEYEEKIWDLTIQRDKAILRSRSLQEKVEKLEDRIEEMTNIALAKPSIVNNTTNNNTVKIQQFLNDNSTPITCDWIEDDNNTDKLTLHHLLGNGQGIADYMTENILVDNRHIVCLDMSRNKYTYLVEKNKSIIDIYLKTLLFRMFKSIAHQSQKIMGEHIKQITPTLDMSNQDSLNQLQEYMNISKNIKLAAGGELNYIFNDTLRHLRSSRGIMLREQLI